MKQRKDGRWAKSITIDGKRVYFYSKKKTERQAITDINRQVVAYKSEKDAKAEISRQFCKVAEEWERIHYETIEWGTIRSYKPACADCVDFFGDTDIRNITAQNVNAFIMKQCMTGHALKTVKHRLLVLNLIFKHAIMAQYVENNPCQYISVPKNLPKQKRHMPSEEELEVVKNSVDKPFGLFAYFLLYTGLRRGEALALRYEDIDFKNKLIHVRRSAYWMGNTPYLKQPKTEAGNRDVFLLDNLAAHLDPNGKGYVFGDTDGTLMRASRIRDAWNRYIKETGLDITPHQLRHAYAGILFDAGLDVKDAQDQMGHASIAMTRDIYTQISKIHKERVYDKLNDFIRCQNDV